MEIAGIRFGRRRGDVRCPYCHDRLEGACVACEACGTALHEECRNQHGKCPTLGCSGTARPRLVAPSGPPLEYGRVLDDEGLARLARLAALRPGLEAEWNARGRPAAGARRRLRGELELNETALRFGAALCSIGAVLFALGAWASSRPPIRGGGEDAFVLGCLAAVFAALTAVLGFFALRAAVWSTVERVLDLGRFSVGLLTVEKRSTGDGESWIRTLLAPRGRRRVGDGPGDVVDAPPPVGPGGIGPESGEVPVAVWHVTSGGIPGGTGASGGSAGAPARPTLYVQPAVARGFLVTGTRPRLAPAPQQGPALSGPTRAETGDETAVRGQRSEPRARERTE